MSDEKRGTVHIEDRTQQGASPDVTNALTLSLPCSLWWGMDQDCITEMNKIQIRYAAHVAGAAATAYQEILKAMDEASKRKPS